MNLSVYKKQVLLVTCLMFLLSITNVFANPYVKNATEYKSEVPFFIEKLSLNKTEVSLSSAAIYNKSYYKLGASKAIKKKETSFFEGMLNAVKGFVFSSKVTAAAFVVGGTGPGDDFDGDGVLNKDDIDDDNDGILDADEMGTYPPGDGTQNCKGIPADGGAMILNNSFTSPTVLKTDPSNSNGGYATTTEYWTIASGSVDTKNSDVWGLSPYDINTGSSQSLDLNGSNPGFIEQSVDVVPNTPYTLSFYYSGRALNITGTLEAEVVDASNNSLVSLSIPSSDFSFQWDGTKNEYVELASFTPTTSSVKIKLSAPGSTGSQGPLIDGIELKGATPDSVANLCPPLELDTDNDGIPNHLDLDSDGDGCSDAYEAGATTDTTADYQFPDVDANNDGLVDAVDAGSDGAVDYTPTYAQTIDGASSCPVVVTCTDPNKYSATCDFDGDGVLNKDDLDDDNDGILDTVEGFCYQTPEFVMKATATASGAGSAGFPVLNMNIPSERYGFLVVLVTVERDHTGAGGVGGNWAYPAGTVAPLKFAGTTLNSLGSLYTYVSDLPRDISIAKHSMATTVYYIAIDNVALVNESFDFSGFSPPKNAGDEFSITAVYYKGVVGIEYKKHSIEMLSTTNSWNISGESTNINNVLMSYSESSNDTGITGTPNWDFIASTKQANSNGTLTDLRGSNENSGLSTYLESITGVLGSQTASYTVSPDNIHQGGIMFELKAEVCNVPDTDKDGAPDYFDLDSDNDGCPDALEGTQTTLTLASVDGKGILTGAVDANGVPTIVSGGQADVSGADPAITGGQCDDDGDGVINKDDKCNGFDDKADNDTDLVPDGCDLDDDNDGILDSVECTLSFVNFSSNTRFGVGLGEVGIDGSIDVSTRFSLPAGSVIINYENLSTRTTGGQPAVSASQPTTFTITGTVPVYVAIRHGGDLSGVNSYDGIESLDNVTYNFTSTLETGYTDSVLANNYQVISDASSDGNNADKFRWQSSSFVSKFKVVTSRTTLNNNYRLELAICKDTDSDGTPDYLDRDSDNDGCSDALEGAQTTLTLASVDGKGILTGAVDANGVPTLVSGGQADVSSTDPAITGGECDDDGDGVLNKDDKCNGFDDAIDSDTDGVPDGCDLDNDNDGILDSVECGALLPGAVTGIDTNTLTGTFTSSVLSTDFTLTSPSQIELPLGNKIPVKFKSYAGVTEGILAYWDEGNVIPNTFDIKFTLQAPVNGVLNALRIASNAPGSAYGAQNAKKQITLTWPGGTRAVLSDPLNEIVNLTDGAVITSGTILELDSGTNQILNSRWYLDIDLAGVSYPFSLDYHTVSSVLTRYEGFSFLPKGCSDLDGDTLTNNLDLDSDADGCNDVLESGGIDADNDGILDGTGFDADGKVTGGVNGYDGATGNEYKATKLTADFTALTDQTVAEGTATSFTLTSATAETTISYDASNNPVYGTTGNANIGIQYQWYLGDPATGTALTNTGVYSTVTTATLNISDVKGLGGSVYYLKVTHADNVCIESVGSATLSVFDPCKIGAILGTVTANDPDADGINNVCDSDDDNDGISDTDENINNKNPDADADADGIPLYLDDDDTNAAIGDVNNSIEADFDTDNDGIPNHLDLDADNDGIYDVVEAGGTDTNNDGKADHSGADYSDTAGIPDSAFFGLGVIPKNTNTITGNPADFLNIDSDGDGCSDANEAYNNANTDTNSDGTYGGVITSAEVNANGLVTGAAYGAPNANYTIVSYINSICYIDICTEAAGTDTDNDRVNDICDVDIDNDGILNENENCNSPVWGTAPLTWIAKDDSGTITLAGGIDMSIDITTTATGDLDAFGGTALNLSATGTGTFGTLDDLAVLFDPAANQGASPVKIQIDFTKEMYNLNFKITDIDAGGFGFRMDKITITSDVGNPILTKVSETSSSFTVANNQATAIRYATSDKDNKGTILVQVPDGAKSITIIYEEVGTVSDPGVRGIGILGDLKYCLDTDNDGTPDSNDLDSDNDGCNDVLESGGIDADNDGILDGTGFDADGKVTGGVNGYDGATGNEYKATKLTADFTALTDQTVTEGTGTSFTLTSAIADEATAYVAGVPTYGTPGNADAGIQYQWYLGDPATGTALTNTGVYTTVTTATLNISDVTGLGGNKYYLKVTHADNVCIESVGSATLTVNNFPVADNDSSTGNVPGADTVVNIIDGDVLGDGTQADPTDVTVALIAPKSGTLNANGTVTVPGEGVWAYNDATGELTFNPDAGFTTDPTDITYTITEIATTLTSAAAIVHVEYTEADPIANNDTNTTPGTPGVNVTIPLLPNDDLSDGTQATVDNTSIVLIDPVTSLPSATP
ncbi:beta strand repeat-containing protein, partial [Tenacibaculum finnmarkense]|uniref:beta strand repeat-containing protein n=2 Tax=Tenacibaculum finnmarkense TaxID=2781243 RepID=UPI001EFBC85B